MSVSSVRAPRVFTFGSYRLDCNDRVLLRGDAPIRLSPKDFDILLLLVENSGHLVDKSEIRTRIWPGTSVDDNNLAQHISALRKTLGDSEAGTPYIETLPRIGYRFVADVRRETQLPLIPPDSRVIASDSERSSGTEGELAATIPLPVGSSSKSRAWERRLAASFLIAATLLAGFAALSYRRGPAIQSIAVLPLANLSGDPSQDYFAEGMTDALITNLSKIGSLKVISPGSVVQYRNSATSAADIGRTLKVDAVVRGAVVRSGNRIRITAQLIRTASNQNIWADEYDRNYEDIIALQNDVVSEIAARIRTQLTTAEKGRLSGRPRVNAEAQDAYLKGRYFWNRRTESGFLKGIKYFEEAIGYDSRFASAYAGLADAYALLGSMPTTEIARSDAMARARMAAEHALQLDDSLAEAHTSLAFVKMHYDWDWQGAEHEFQQALLLNRNYATAHHWHAYNLMAMGRSDDALAELRYARTLDPLSPIINADLGEALFYARRYDDALRQTRATIAVDPSFPLSHQLLQRIYTAKNMLTEAIKEGQTAIDLAPSDRRMRGQFAVTLAYAGRADDARKLLSELESEPSRNGWTDLWTIYAAIGDTDQVFRRLDMLYRDRDGSLLLLNYEPGWDCCRSDPRFREIVRKVGLPDGGN